MKHNSLAISVVGVGSISALGNSQKSVWEAYENPQHYLQKSKGNFLAPAGFLSSTSEVIIEQIRQENTKYNTLDKSVLLAIYASRRAVRQAHWGSELDFGINIGSSRGATELFEKYHQQFLEYKKCSPLTSPTTTLGNIASWVAQDIDNKNIAFSHSITCSSALHALLNGVAWLQSGMAKRFLVGGSEAPLTPFTLAQMQALKIYGNANADFPCQTLLFPKSQNTMVLGEGACMLCLENEISEKTLAVIRGIGYCIEPLKHNISISERADCLQQTMRMAIGGLPQQEIDVIIPHATGTIKGDWAEYQAIETIFGKDKMPFLTSNKWKIGHTFGASGAFSLEMGILMLTHQQYIPIPYLPDTQKPKKIRNILVNAVGFGGNAVSVLLSAK